ncbi:amino acid ABC transporter permease [Ruminococcaceae bacterium OttesenSCG-928-A16]|nr:amino acid ABC transporter permease [Ruminococcaceae bacterium OttesenSCG-928-A16]
MQTILDNLYGALIRENRWQLYLQGLAITLQITLVACLIGIVLGMLVAVVKIYAVGSRNPVLKALNVICNFYTTVIRGTPMVLQLLIIYFGLTFLPSGVVACYIGFGINSGAYASEIFRGGINSVDAGQMEAGRSLGLSRNSTMRYIVMPQAVKNILPSLFNELISLLKETSIAGYIAVNDLTKLSNGIKGRTLNIYPLFVAGALYLLLTVLLTQVQRWIERRFARSDRG